MLVFSWALLTLSLVLGAKAKVIKKKKDDSNLISRETTFTFFTEHSAIYAVKYPK